MKFENKLTIYYENILVSKLIHSRMIDHCDIIYFQTTLFSDFSILSLAEALANIYILVCNLKRTFLFNLLYKHMVAKDEQ